MSKMNSKILIGISLILLLLGNVYLFSLPDDQGKKGLNEFLDYLNNNKDQLKYKNVGVLEHSDRIEVRIHCDEETLGKIMSGADNFGFTKINVIKNTPESITVVAIFPKNGTKAQKPETKQVQKQAPDKKAPSPKQKKEIKPKKCPKKVKVQVKDVSTQTFMEYKYFKKPIAPAKEVQIPSPTDEKIVEVLVNPGDEVKKDQLLLKYDTEKILEKLTDAEGELKLWKQKLFKREHWKVRSTPAENQAKRHIASAETAIKENTELLKQMEIKAPLDGKVTFIAEKDSTVPTGKTAVTIVNSSVMKINLPNSDQNLFQDEQRIILSFKKFDLSYVGRVQKKDNELNIVIENETFKLKEGWIANFRILLKKHENAITISPNMLIEDEKGKFLYLVDEKYAKKAYITPGPVEEGKVLVRSGLSIEDKIITTGIECLEDGKKIKIIEPKKPTKKKAKPGKKPAKEKKSKPAVGISDKGCMKLSLGLAYHMVGDDIFKEVYGSSLMGGYVEAGFSFTRSLEIFVAASYLTKKGTFTQFPDEVTLNMFPAYVGGKFKFKMPSKIKPYIGAAVAIYNVKEKTDTVDTPYNKGTGFSLLVGSAMNLSKKLGVFLDLKYDLVKIAIEDATEDLDLSGLKLSLGLSYKFKLF